jgi:hypothetical protein
MLVSAHDRGVDHPVFVVVIARQQSENAVKNSALRPPAEALVDDLPIAETLWKIPPRDAGPKSIQNRFDEQSVVGRRASHVAFAAGKKILDPIPLVVAQCIPSHRSAPRKADHP